MQLLKYIFSTRLSHSLHAMTALQKYHSFMSPCIGHPLPHFLWHHSHAWSSVDPPVLLRSIRNSALQLLDESSGSSFVSFGVHGAPSLVPFVSVEKLSRTLDLSVTKPARGPSPTHYAFGIISCAGANHTEALEELGSCGHLHNAWCASSSIVLFALSQH